MDEHGVVTSDMLEQLPAPVQRYMRFTGVVGKPWINTVRVKYSGKFRMGADKPWMPIKANQCYTTNPPGFLWKATLKIAGLPLFHGNDIYKAGHGHMYGKLAGVYTLFDLRGDELDQGSMMRYLNEMGWFPTAYLGKNISWQSVDECSAQVTFNDCGKSVSARIFFDEQGRLTNFKALRYRLDNGTFSLDPWSTPFTEFGMRAGLNLPIRGQAIWNLPSGDLPYVDIYRTEIEYNVPIASF